MLRCGDTTAARGTLTHSGYCVLFLPLGHFEYKPRELSPGAVYPVVVGELREHRDNEDCEDEAQQPQKELLDLAVRLRRAEDLLVEHHDLECRVGMKPDLRQFSVPCFRRRTGLSFTSKSDSGPHFILLLSPILLMRFCGCIKYVQLKKVPQ